jgi:hypothetical protein
LPSAKGRYYWVIAVADVLIATHISSDTPVDIGAMIRSGVFDPVVFEGTSGQQVVSTSL